MKYIIIYNKFWAKYFTGQETTEKPCSKWLCNVNVMDGVMTANFYSFFTMNKKFKIIRIIKIIRITRDCSKKS